MQLHLITPKTTFTGTIHCTVDVLVFCTFTGLFLKTLTGTVFLTDLETTWGENCEYEVENYKPVEIEITLK